MAQYIGNVKWFNNVKSIDLSGRGGGPDTFVRYSSIQQDAYKTVKEGEDVAFDVVQSDKDLPQSDQVVRLEVFRKAT